MHPRHVERRLALDALYQADVTGVAPSAVLEEWREATGDETAAFAGELVRGVEDHLPEIDGVIGDLAEGWTVDRLAAVDRAILRLAILELLYRTDTPVAVAVSEAVEAAHELSTEDSGRFVNGILGRVARERAADR
jgi:transcription antitermination protein NusB